MMNPNSTIKSIVTTVGPIAATGFKTLAGGVALGVGAAAVVTFARTGGSWTSLAYRVGQSVAKRPMLAELISAVNHGAQLAEAEQEFADAEQRLAYLQRVMNDPELRAKWTQIYMLRREAEVHNTAMTAEGTVQFDSTMRAVFPHLGHVPSRRVFDDQEEPGTWGYPREWAHQSPQACGGMGT